MRTQLKRDLPLLLVRADADATRGAGHVMRCLALAQAWQEHGGRVTFIGGIPQPLVERIRAAGFDCRQITERHPEPGDLQLTLSVLDDVDREIEAPPWVLLDGYHFDPTYQGMLRAVGARLIVIDDTAHCSYYDADLILNHAINAERLSYDCAPDAMLLLGTRYALLRSEFGRWRQMSRSTPQIARKVLVTLGGGDGANVTLKVIQALGQLCVPDWEARIVVGPLNPHLEELKRAVKPLSLSARLETDVTDPSALMAWADIAVAAAGTTSWELAFMSVPTVLLILADNQAGVAQGLEDFEVAHVVGVGAKVSSVEIANALQALMHDRPRREEMARMGNIVVDGRGADRVVECMLHEPNDAGDYRIRLAQADDGFLLWLWANDPVIRKNSFAPQPIAWWTHEQWYARTLRSPASRIWILEYRHVPVGQIRYDRLDAETAQISFSVGARFRGRGMGTRLLNATVDLAGRELAVDCVQGITFADNEASRRAFSRANFRVIEERVTAGRACLVFRRPCVVELVEAAGVAVD
jgi:UDP-2,4-diacetamido-2,4,6-trideoxy-beta-L-altropyranose hydrolase